MGLIGQRLRALRLERKLSLRQAADRSNLSHSFIGMVESGTAEIAISRLLRLADAYGVLITELLQDVVESEPEVTSADDLLSFPGTAPGVAIQPLTSPSWSMQPFRVLLEPGTELRDLTHVHEEFVHCIKGSITYLVENAEHVLKPGDTLYLPGGFRHGYVNTGRGKAALIGATARTADNASRL
jgi:transcriptional regulator with XRE-family HTH domain